jgi:hypothetical protein
MPDWCETCRFWVEDQEDEEIGCCHRYPPRVVIRRGDCPDSLWPETDYDDWCGEHQPAEEIHGPSVEPTPN